MAIYFKNIIKPEIYRKQVLKISLKNSLYELNLERLEEKKKKYK